jgi:urea transport system ATP-binding protein
MLKVESLNQYYGGSHILRDVAFTAPAGQVTCLLGRNGVGKTTLLKCLMGLVSARSGRIEFEAKEITGLPSYARVRAGIGYVPQGREIFPRLTVEENLQMGMASLPRGTKLPERIFELFPVLKSMLKRRGGDLSGGQQQQLAIGRALAMNPRLLILDEPTEGIQPSIIKDIERAIRVVAASKPNLEQARKSGERQEIMEAIQKVAATGEVAILLVEQYYDFARALADQYLVMERGEIIKRGSGADMDKDGVRELLSV